VSFTRADIERMQEALRTYARIRFEWDARFDGCLREVDLIKSRLLGRLLTGGAPLPMPPPLCYAGPWYDLIEEGGADLDDSDVSIGTHTSVHIAHDGRWAIQDSEPDDRTTLRYAFETSRGRHVDWGTWSLTRRDTGWRLEQIEATNPLPRL
jgi:hypothetical protein